jgi:hypothetical protein
MTCHVAVHEHNPRFRDHHKRNNCMTNGRDGLMGRGGSAHPLALDRGGAGGVLFFMNK